MPGKLKLPWGSGGDRQLRLDQVLRGDPIPAPWLPPSAQPRPSSRPDAAGAAGRRPGAATVMCQFSAFLRMDAGTQRQGRAPEHLEPDSCGHYPPWSQLLPGAHELLAGKVFIRLAFLKRIYKWLQVCSSSMIQALCGKAF